MPSPQTAIFRSGALHHHYLEYDFDRSRGGVEARRAAVRAAVLGARAHGVDVVTAFDRRSWSELSGGTAPSKLADFARLEAGGRVMPATQRALFFWIQSDRLDTCTDAAFAVERAVSGHALRRHEQRGFQYHRSRDLTGFEDGTGNPKGTRRIEAAVVPAGEEGEGGSYVLAQEWVHDLPKFLALPVEEQERVMGRTKTESIELTGDAMPKTSHVSRTDVKVDGVGQKIWRRSAPFGDATCHGLYFLAFACDPARFDVQLRRMIGLAGDGLYDRLMDFSAARTGSYWFAPSEQALASAVGLP